MVAAVAGDDDVDAWRLLARCRGADTNLFYPSPGPKASPDDKRRANAAALAICEQCPVREPCRDEGRRNMELGVWGESERQRRRARKEMGYARRSPESAVG